MAPPRAPRGTRVATGLLALAVAAGVAAWPALAGGEPRLLLVGAVPVALLAAALAARGPAAVTAALALLGGEFALYLVTLADDVDLAAPAIAAGLVVCAELAFWSLESRPGITEEPGGVLRRIGGLATLAALAVAVGTALLGVAEVGAGRPAALELIGLAAAVGALGVVAFLAQRST